MTYIYDRSFVDLSCSGSFIYNWGIVVLHVFTSLLGGVTLCIPYGLYNGTSLGKTTRGTLEGYPGRVFSTWYQSSRFLNSLGLYIVV